ncbi:MAG: hypothetical protein R3F46_14465 [bacterium]
MRNPNITCPFCEERTLASANVCRKCGFPFSCDISEYGRSPLRRVVGHTWKILLVIAAIAFAVTGGTFFNTSTENYQGLTAALINHLEPDTDSGIPITGPQDFVHRTQMALGLLESRSPHFYFRMQQYVTEIEYFSGNELDVGDRQVPLEGIGAVSTPSTGHVLVLSGTAYNSGLHNYYDRDIFVYAGVLVHELRHIELHAFNQAPGGWEEEKLCEEAAYAAIRQMDAPGGVQANYQMYLVNPQANRYQHWYDWYRNFD